MAVLLGQPFEYLLGGIHNHIIYIIYTYTENLLKLLLRTAVHTPVYWTCSSERGHRTFSSTAAPRPYAAGSRTGAISPHISHATYVCAVHGLNAGCKWVVCSAELDHFAVCYPTQDTGQVWVKFKQEVTSDYQHKYILHRICLLSP